IEIQPERVDGYGQAASATGDDFVCLTLGRPNHVDSFPNGERWPARRGGNPFVGPLSADLVLPRAHGRHEGRPGRAPYQGRRWFKSHDAARAHAVQIAAIIRRVPPLDLALGVGFSPDAECAELHAPNRLVELAADADGE